MKKDTNLLFENKTAFKNSYSKINPLVINLIAVVLSFVFTNHSDAFLFSDYANVKVPMNPSGLLFVDQINFVSATLTGNGKTYTAFVSNPWLSNNGTFTFKNVYVAKGLNYSLTYSYKNIALSKQNTTTVYVARPWDSTYTTKTVSFRP